MERDGRRMKEQCGGHPICCGVAGQAEAPTSPRKALLTPDTKNGYIVNSFAYTALVNTLSGHPSSSYLGVKEALWIGN